MNKQASYGAWCDFYVHNSACVDSFTYCEILFIMTRLPVHWERANWVTQTKSVIRFEKKKPVKFNANKIIMLSCGIKLKLRSSVQYCVVACETMFYYNDSIYKMWLILVSVFLFYLLLTRLWWQLMFLYVFCIVGRMIVFRLCTVESVIAIVQGWVETILFLGRLNSLYSSL